MKRVVLEIDLSVYPLEIVLRACHTLSAQCCVFASVAGEGTVTIELECDQLDDPAGAFRDALRDLHARAAIAAETSAICESFAAEAFGDDDEGTEQSGPIRIVR